MSVKTPLEELFEQGLAELGVDFSPRMYGEQVATAASVDDVLADESTEEVRRQTNEAIGISPMIGLITDLIGFRRLTTEQQRMMDDPQLPFFFERKSRDYEGWSIDYVVHTDAEVSAYEPVAEQLIQAGEANRQEVHLSYEGIPYISIEINTTPNSPLKVLTIQPIMDRMSGDNYELTKILTKELHPELTPDEIESRVREASEEVEEQLRYRLMPKEDEIQAMSELSGKAFNPQEVYQAVMNFLKAGQ